MLKVNFKKFESVGDRQKEIIYKMLFASLFLSHVLTYK